MSVEREAKISVYEMNGEGQFGLDPPKLVIRSHWNRKEFVVIEIDDDSTIAVLAHDLERAIQVCSR